MNEKEIMLAGDWHGDLEWGVNMVLLTRAFNIDYIFHVGDFGIWPGQRGQVFLEVLNDRCREQDVTIFVTLGNHEDWDLIDTLTPDEDGLIWIRDHVALLPRGYRWEMNGRSFVSLGGAPSIDYPARTRHIDWFPTEMITMEVAEAVAEAGHAEVMLTHDSPSTSSKAVEKIIHDPEAGRWWTQEGLAYAKEGRMLLDIAVDGVKPKLLAHGHFHVGDSITLPGGRKVISLDQQRTKKNIAVLDLDTLHFKFVDPWAEWGKRAPAPVKVVG